MIFRKDEVKKILDSPSSWVSILTSMAQQCRNLWLSLVFSSIYLLVTLFSLTHRDLFLEAPIALPVIQLTVPVTGFLWFAPFILLSIHLFLLLSILTLTKRAKYLLGALSSSYLRQRDVDELRMQLSGFFILAVLAPTQSDRRDGMYHLSVFATVATLVLAPLLVFLLFILQALPLHQMEMLYFLRFAFLVNVLATVFVCIKLFNAKNRLLILSIYFSSLLFATYFVFSLISLPADIEPTLHKISLKSVKSYLVEGVVNEVTGQRSSLFSNTLVLSDKNLRAPKDNSISMRGRNLDGALFIRATFSEIDFTGASLREANFLGAKADQANFGCAKDGGDFNQLACTNLEKAIFDHVEFLRVNFSGSNLSSADLSSARFREAEFIGANLSAARFLFAKVERANFSAATGIGTQFESSELSGANFSRSKLIGANFHSVVASGANFSSSNMIGSIFDMGEFQAADFSYSDLRASTFSDADISLSFMFQTNLSGITNFSDVKASGVVTAQIINDEVNLENNVDFDNLLKEFGDIKLLQWTMSNPPENVQSLLTKRSIGYDDLNINDFLKSSLKYPTVNELSEFSTSGWENRIRKLIEAYCDPLGKAWFSSFDFALSWYPNLNSSIGFLGPYRRGVSEELMNSETCKTSSKFTEAQLSTLGNYVTAEPNVFELNLPSF